MPDASTTTTNTTNTTNTTGPAPRTWTAPLAVAGFAAVAAAVVVGAFALVGELTGVPFRDFSKDPVETLVVVYYIGYLAHAVMLVWYTGAVAALVAGVALRATGHRSASTMLLAGGALTTLMVLDDVFLLHENVYPRLGMPEQLTYPVYGLLTLAFAWWFRRRLRTELVILGAAYVAWVAAAGFELGQELYGIHHHLGEDGGKAVGAALWTAFMIRIALVELTTALRGAAAAPEADGEPATERIPVTAER